MVVSMTIRQSHRLIYLLCCCLLGAIACTKNNPPLSQVPAQAQAQVNRQQTGYRLTTILEGLEHPWSMAWLPDGSLLITERPGRLQLLRSGSNQMIEITGVPPVFAQGQGGLMDVSLHPKFSENRWIYFTYAHGTADANRTRLARATFEGQQLQNVQVIFEVSQPKSGTQHFGSRFAWQADGTMLLAIGDGGNPPISLEGNLIRQQAQNRRSHLGKILRLKEDGTVLSDNPFAKDTQANPAVWSYGHRNIQGLTIDPKTQQVWASEHGSQGGDELNLLQVGQNYGWPLVTHSREYSGGEISQARSRPGLVDPKVVWTPSIAPSGLMVYRGDRFPQWQGQVFAGGLVSKDIRRIVVDTSGKEVSQDSISVGERVRDVRQGADGLIYILTDEDNGKLIKLEPTE
jgi:aldose sugar dehydrogenase